MCSVRAEKKEIDEEVYIECGEQGENGNRRKKEERGRG